MKTFKVKDRYITATNIYEAIKIYKDSKANDSDKLSKLAFELGQLANYFDRANSASSRKLLAKNDDTKLKEFYKKGLETLSQLKLEVANMKKVNPNYEYTFRYGDRVDITNLILDAADRMYFLYNIIDNENEYQRFKKLDEELSKYAKEYNKLTYKYVEDSKVNDGSIGNSIASSCDKYYNKLHPIYSEMFKIFDTIEDIEDYDEDLWQAFYEAHDNLSKSLSALMKASRMAKKIKDSKVNDTKANDANIYETIKNDLVDEPSHSADYLWTWASGHDFNPSVAIRNTEKVEHTKTNAMSLLNMYYLELKKEVERRLKEGFAVRMRQINSSKLKDSINDNMSSKTKAAIKNWWETGLVNFFTKKDYVQTISSDTLLREFIFEDISFDNFNDMLVKHWNGDKSDVYSKEDLLNYIKSIAKSYTSTIADSSNR